MGIGKREVPAQELAEVCVGVVGLFRRRQLIGAEGFDGFRPPVDVGGRILTHQKAPVEVFHGGIQGAGIFQAHDIPDIGLDHGAFPPVFVSFRRKLSWMRLLLVSSSSAMVDSLMYFS